MKLLLAFFFFLTAHSSFAQCISIKEMRAFFFKNIEARESFMDSRSFVVSDVHDMGIIWVKSKGKFSFVVDFDDSGKAWMVSYDSPPSKNCYDLLKLEISNLGLHKDEQFYVGTSFVTFYSNAKYGVMLDKGSFNGREIFSVKVISKARYYSQIEEVKP